MSAGCAWDWRLSLTIAGLEKNAFRAYGIPVPSIAPFSAASIESSRSEGGQALHGYANIDFLWEELTSLQAFYVAKFINGAKDGTGWLYMTVDLNDDSAPGTQWADVRGKPHRDYKNADAGPIVGRQRGGTNFHENYRLFLNSVEIINNPSAYTSS